MADSSATQAAAAVHEGIPAGAVDRLLGFLAQGGPVLYLLAVVSVITLALIIAKFIQFWMARVHARGFVEPALGAWQDGRLREALGLLERERSPVARVLAVALRGTAAGAAPGTASEGLVREEVARVAGLELDNLRSGLRALALIANISPLLGLLGTVLGMIDAFQTLQGAGNRVDPSILSGGIWVALLTTAAGLIIAIPAAAAHNWLEGAVHRVQRAMEDAVTRVFTRSVDPAAGGDRPVQSTAAAGRDAAQPAE